MSGGYRVIAILLSIGGLYILLVTIGRVLNPLYDGHHSLEEPRRVRAPGSTPHRSETGN